ncbi:MAG: carbon-nitrogen hydrolase [Acidobacteria bacterium]|nr:carbon-nitrogen hydrolase [Acidobacteriota bacterium]MYK89558.1 carbon-nitrogen hydrolase [Acidobacteriota bacterium]
MTRAPASAAGEFTIGLVQMACHRLAARNHEAAEAGIRDATARGAQIVCLQELFATPYFCQREDAACFDLAEEIPGTLTTRYSRLARALGVVLIVPFFERRAAGLYHNSAVVIDASGDLLGLYRKVHVPDDPQFLEKYYFTPGDLGYRVFETRHARIGVLICWDQWYPEAARLTALQGAEAIFYPTAIGWLGAGEPGGDGLAERDAWMTVQRGHAIANGVYVAVVNRVGTETTEAGALRFWGGSFVSDPGGRVIARADGETAGVVVARCSRRALEEQRRAWPFLRDRRIDTYASITRRYLDDPPHKAQWAR